MSEPQSHVNSTRQTQRAIARLRRQVDWSEGFWLGYVFTPSPSQAHLLQEAVGQQLRALGRSQRILRPSSPDELERVLTEILQDGEAGCTWVEAIRGRSSTPDAWSDAWISFVLRANERRELLRSVLTGGLVLVAHPDQKADLRRAAPDLWSIRARVFELPSDPTLRGDRFEGLGGVVEGRRERPRPDIELLETDLARLEELLSSQDAEDQIETLLRVAGYLEGGGRDAEAVEYLQRAVGLVRLLVPTRPDRFLPVLSVALSELGVTLPRMGLREEALAASSESLAIRRELVKTKPDEFMLDLARALNNHGLNLNAVGRLDEAIAVVHEGLGVLRELEKARPDLDGKDHAKSLINLGWLSSSIGELDKALAATQEALFILRERVRVGTDEVRGDLATSLNNIAMILLSLGRWLEALEAAREGVEILRELDVAQSLLWKPDLAMSLHGLALASALSGRLDDAKSVIGESVDIRRELAKAHPDAFEPDLASSLGLLGSIQRDCGEIAQSQTSLREGLGLLRPHYRRFPAAFQSLVFDLLDDLETTCRVGGFEFPSELNDYLSEP